MLEDLMCEENILKVTMSATLIHILFYGLTVCRSTRRIRAEQWTRRTATGTAAATSPRIHEISFLSDPVMANTLSEILGLFVNKPSPVFGFFIYFLLAPTFTHNLLTSV